MDTVQKALDELTIAAHTLVDAEEAYEKLETAFGNQNLRGAVLEKACDEEYDAKVLVMKAKDKLSDVAREYVKVVRGVNLHKLDGLQKDSQCEYTSGHGFRCIRGEGHTDPHTWGDHEMMELHHQLGTFRCTRCGATSGDKQGRNVGPCFPDEMVEER